MNNKNTGEFILACRKELGLTQVQLAEKLNVTDKAVSKWETGKSAPDIAILLPMAEVLGVSVVEILVGKKMEQSEVRTASDITIVNTMKKSKQKLVLTVVATLVLVAVLLSIYPIYKYLSTVPGDDINRIEQMANQYIGDFNIENQGSELITCKQKGEYLVALMKNDHHLAVVVFTRDNIFPERFAASGVSYANEFGNVLLHCFGENGVTANIFYGADIDSNISRYRFEYRNVEYICPVEKGIVLDVFLDISESFTNAYGIELLE